MSPIVAFSLTADEHRALDAAAAEHALSASQWAKAAVLALAATVAHNRKARTARHTARKPTRE